MKNKDKQNKSIEDLTYDILGNAFVGNLFDISNDIDNTSQNLVAYLELEDIKKLSKKDKNKIIPGRREMEKDRQFKQNYRIIK